MSKRRPHPVPDYTPHVEEPPWDQIILARADVIARYTQMQIDHFFAILTDLPSYLVRISEQVKLQEDNLQVTTKLTYQYSPQRLDPGKKDELDTLLIPLFTPEKGVLIDDLNVVDGSANEVTTLSQYDIRGLLAITLEAFFRLAKEEGPDSSDQEQSGSRGTIAANLTTSRHSAPPGHNNATNRPDNTTTSHALIELAPHETDALNELIRVVCHVGIPSEIRCRKAFNLLKNLTSISMEWKVHLERFCRLYAQHYAIVAEVVRPNGNQVALTYSQQLPLESSNDRTDHRLHWILGLGPTKVDLPLALYAFRVGSYHLQINAPPGLYIHDHHLEKMGSRQIVDKRGLVDNDESDPQFQHSAQPYVRLHQGKARTNAHLYIRRQRIVSQMAELKSVFEFREIPPGTLGDTVVVASATAFIITFFALTRFGMNGPPTTPNSDLPTILLAIPAFVAALIGPWGKLSRTNLGVTTYFGLASTFALSVISVLLYILDANMELPTEFSITVASFTLKTEIIWLTLMSVAIFLPIYLTYKLLLKMRDYSK